MSSKSMYHNQPSWKPPGFKLLGPAGRAKIREREAARKAKAALEREKARKKAKEAAEAGATVDGVAVADVQATMKEKTS